MACGFVCCTFSINCQSFAPVFGLFVELVFLSKYIIMSSCSPRVSFCGYSIPHPSESRVNIRVQTTGKIWHTLVSSNILVILNEFCLENIFLIILATTKTNHSCVLNGTKIVCQSTTFPPLTRKRIWSQKPGSHCLYLHRQQPLSSLSSSTTLPKAAFSLIHPFP